VTATKSNCIHIIDKDRSLPSKIKNLERKFSEIRCPQALWTAETSLYVKN